MYKSLFLLSRENFLFPIKKEKDNCIENFKKSPRILTSLQNSYYHFCLFSRPFECEEIFLYNCIVINIKCVHAFFQSILYTFLYSICVFFGMWWKLIEVRYRYFMASEMYHWIVWKFLKYMVKLQLVQQLDLQLVKAALCLSCSEEKVLLCSMYEKFC